MVKFKRFNLSLIAMTVIMCAAAFATVTYAAITAQVTTAQEKVTITAMGTVSCSVLLTSNNIFLADSSGNKTTTQARLFPAGNFAVPLRFSYSGDSRDAAYQKVAVKTGSGSFTFSTINIVCLGNGTGGAATNSTQFNKYFTTAQIRVSGSSEIVKGTNNDNYYLYLATKSPADTSVECKPANYFTNSISSITLKFNITVYAV